MYSYNIRLIIKFVIYKHSFITILQIEYNINLNYVLYSNKSMILLLIDLLLG